jgi:hypothetical protein
LLKAHRSFLAHQNRSRAPFVLPHFVQLRRFFLVCDLRQLIARKVRRTEKINASRLNSRRCDDERRDSTQARERSRAEFVSMTTRFKESGGAVLHLRRSRHISSANKKTRDLLGSRVS